MFIMFIRGAFRRLWNLVRRSRMDDELREELAAHLAMIEEEERARGLTPDQARQRARVRFGSPLAYREHALDAVLARWLEDAWQDVRFAVRQLRRAPGFTAVAIASLALGIGANTAIFTLMEAVLLKALPVADPASLVQLGDARGWGVGVGQNGSYALYSHALYTDLRESDVFDGLCAFDSADDRGAVRLAGSDSSVLTPIRFVSGNYFQVLGVSAAAGRPLAAADDEAAASPTAVVGYRYWRETLDGQLSAIGQTVAINGIPVTIVGVAPPEFYGERIEPDPPAFWLPLSASRQLQPYRKLLDEPDLHWLYLMGRLKPGIERAAAEARLTGMLRNWLSDRPGSNATAARRDRIAKNYVELTPAGGGVPHLRREYGESLRLLLGISIAVLLIACANIAGLLLARGMARRTERSVRLALGATSGRLLRQSLTESLTLALAGGALALVVAPTAAQLLVVMAFAGASYVPIHTTPDGRVLAFTFALSCAAAVVFGLMPALRMPSGLAGEMKSARFRLGRALVVAEVTISLAVLAGAGALARSLANLEHQSFGFDRAHVLVVDVDPRLARYEYGRLGPLYEQLESRLSALPGVRSAGLTYYTPFDGCCWAFSVSVPGYTPSPNERTSTLLNRVSPRYFETLGTSLLRGRVFDRRDSAAARRVIVVNEAFAERYFAGREAIGRALHIDSEGPDLDFEVVGIVENTKYEDPREAVRPMIFLPLLQMKPGESPASGSYQSNFIGAIVVRTAGDPAAIAATVRQTIADVDPALPVLSTRTLAARVSESLQQNAVVATLAELFGALALALTAIGLYGLMAYLVQRQTRDIGIRIALGAARADVIGLVIRDALRQAAIGMLAGIPLALGATRLIASQLYGVGAGGPQHAVTAALVLTVCLAVAAWLPARRAARIDPIRTLRQE